VPGEAARYQTKAKNAQEAHEAIRPTDMTAARRRRAFARADQAKLYELIWKRTSPARWNRPTRAHHRRDRRRPAAHQAARPARHRQVVKFDGFLALYQEGKDDDADDEESRRLPAMVAGDRSPKEIEAGAAFHRAAAALSEASLVKRMEELGIGRPSTYASILRC
jgi:DNA topoisomerase I